MKFFLSTLLVVFSAFAQTPATTAPAPTAGIVVAGPTYFSETGVRCSYYDYSCTETTNLGIRVTKAQNPDVPAGLWTVVSIDATPRSTSSSAALRAGARYFLTSTAGGNVIVYANLQAGATTATTSAINIATSTTTSVTSLLGNLQGGGGLVWRACHTFNPASKINCVVDIDYELNAVSTQAVKPIVGLFVGLAF